MLKLPCKGILWNIDGSKKEINSSGQVAIPFWVRWFPILGSQQNWRRTCLSCQLTDYLNIHFEDTKLCWFGGNNSERIQLLSDVVAHSHLLVQMIKEFSTFSLKKRKVNAVPCVISAISHHHLRIQESIRERVTVQTCSDGRLPIFLYFSYIWSFSSVGYWITWRIIQSTRFTTFQTLGSWEIKNQLLILSFIHLG